MARRRPASPEHDASRREFFRTFSRQTVQNAGAMVGAAEELRRTSMAAARELLDLTPPDAPPAARSEPTALTSGPEPDPTFRSAYRFTGDSIVLLDQRELPERVLTIEAREPSEVAAAIRAGVVTAGPVLGELGAYAVALAAHHARERSAAGREQRLRAAFGTLRATRREVRALSAAVDRMEARYDELANANAAPADLADGLAAEAEAISAEATLAHARVGRFVAEVLSSILSDDQAGEQALGVLVHGDTGPLSCGMVGISTTCFRSILDSGLQVHAWITSAMPSGEGARVSAYQLAQADMPHSVVPDAAVAWLLNTREIDAVLLRGDTVTSTGDTFALIGARQVAQLAADAGVRVLVLAPESAREPDPAMTLPAAGANVPNSEIVPASLISAWVSEAGVS